ncbi:MAG: transglutaminase family protein [Actinomycetota bacterium]|nr:transglutaminase family protein [Actinomycetota bacterium]
MSSDGGLATTTYLLHQRFRYEYPDPIHHLRHRLMVFPPQLHGDQRHVVRRLEIRGAPRQTVSWLDRFGNIVIEVRAALVPEAIEFESWSAVERTRRPRPGSVPEAVLHDRALVDPSPLTRPDPALARAADRLMHGRRPGLQLAADINHWVHDALDYSHDATDVRTTAAEALAIGAGVCQDYAHVMLSLCHLCSLPARYVSGHLVGEGGSHAWVEVVVPDPSRPGSAVAVPFDPTHDRQAGDGYVTVAVGRDYGDVAPTSGTFEASCRGRLFCRKRLQVAPAPVALGA